MRVYFTGKYTGLLSVTLSYDNKINFNNNKKKNASHNVNCEKNRG